MSKREFDEYRNAAQRLYEAMAAFAELHEKHPDGIDRLLTPTQKRQLKQIEDQINGLASRL